MSQRKNVGVARQSLIKMWSFERWLAGAYQKVIGSAKVFAVSLFESREGERNNREC
jgi:hypothetical protein